jgi:hypothetical protein
MVPCNPRVLVVVTPMGSYISGRESHFATCPQRDQFRKRSASA